MGLSERMALFDEADLYVVITEAFCGARSSIEVLEEVLEAGVRLVQLREKDCSDRKLYELALAFRRRTRQAGALLIIDDRLDIALAADADGVHLGLADMPVAAARALAPDLIIGASAHDEGEALAAQDAAASYVNIGPIFETSTKEVATGAIGLGALERIAPQLKVPFTCMGGIKIHNVREVVERGARHPAVVTAVTAESDVRGAALALRRAIESAGT